MALTCLGMLATPSAPAGLFAGEDERGAVTCRFDADAGVLRIRLHAIRFKVPKFPGLPQELEEELQEAIESILVPTVASIERCLDSITVLRGYDGHPVACDGPPPTVSNTDTIRVRRGTHARSAELYLDLRNGPLAPGATDEGNGSSEIEMDVEVGGPVGIRAARSADLIDVTGRVGTTAINLNAGEGVPDDDLLATDESFVFIDGAGAGDVLRSAGEFPLFARYAPLMSVFDGQGDDLLQGHGGDEAFTALAGHDRIEAGGGADLAFAGGTDRVDCGGGHDWLVRSGKSVRDRDCEKIIEVKRLFSSQTVESEQVEVIFRGLPRRLARVRGATLGYLAHRLAARSRR